MTVGMLTEKGGWPNPSRRIRYLRQLALKKHDGFCAFLVNTDR